ncbi:hypothetical protein H6504_04460 [Candidatus Woesearchaeota archaeon]|nr:hypothetical protein [Candidatus Woesearchaeota archaeon]
MRILFALLIAALVIPVTSAFDDISVKHYRVYSDYEENGLVYMSIESETEIDRVTVRITIPELDIRLPKVVLNDIDDEVASYVADFTYGKVEPGEYMVRAYISGEGKHRVVYRYLYIG